MPSPNVQDLSIEPNEYALDEEQSWLEYARVALDKGVKTWTIPLWLAFIPIDYLCYPKIFWKAFVIRIVGLPTTLILLSHIRRAHTRHTFLIRYLIGVGVVSLGMTAIIALTEDPTLHYFTGTCVVGIGTLSVIILPKREFWFAALIGFGPFFVLALANGMAQHYPQYFMLYLFIAISFCLVFYLSQNYFRYLQKREFGLRHSLAKVLSQKEQTVQDLAFELARLKQQNLDLKNKEDTFRQARQLAHDIRSPLSALSAATMKLRDISAELSSLIESSSRRISAIADEFLSDSKRNLSAVELEPLEINTLIRNLVDEKRSVLANKNVTIYFEPVSSALRVTIKALDLSRALSNIIENSIDALPGGGKIKVITRAVQADWAEIQVTDNGKGIPSEIIEHIGSYGFTFGKSNGNGLGLAYAFAVASSANGKIEILSDGQTYTCVKISLPQSVAVSD